MNTANKQNLKTSILLITGSFVAVYLFTWLLPNIFEPLNLRAVDQLFLFRSNSNHFRPPYDGTIVHVDLNDTSIQQLNQFYLNRSHHAQVVSNLSTMKAATLLYDFIFAAPSSEAEDNALIEAASKAGNTYFGLAFDLGKGQRAKQNDAQFYQVKQYLEKTGWQAATEKDPSDFYKGVNPLITFPALSSASRVFGFINLKPDRDGVFRRAPLLVKYENVFYPSLAFRAICDYLNVGQDKIIINPGKFITLKEAQKPGHPEKHDINIPIDRYGNLIINFVGPWERMKHYNFSGILRASESRDEMELWTEELSGKIVIISEVSTGSSDVGPVPTDSNYPLSGVSANVIHTILTESFLTEPSAFKMVFAELLLLIILLMLSLRFSSATFSFGAIAVAFGYTGLSAFLFLYTHVILNIVRPLLMMGFALISIQIARAIENARAFAETEKAKKIAEHELEIGRKIQSGFLPDKLPVLPDWEITAHFKPARQVAGDFYDAFPLVNGQKIGIVIADVCDKGVGAALFMALFRSLIRAFALQSFFTMAPEENFSDRFVDDALQRTITLTNNYIAETHSQANMFATIFFGVLDPKTGCLNYINGGHEPPIITDRGGNSIPLSSTGAAVGMMPDLAFVPKKIQLNPGDTLFAYTDGVTDAQNPDGDFFSKERLLSLLNQNAVSAQALMDAVRTQIYDHISNAEQYDDVTMIAVRRKDDLPSKNCSG